MLFRYSRVHDPDSQPNSFNSPKPPVTRIRPRHLIPLVIPLFGLVVFFLHPFDGVVDKFHDMNIASWGSSSSVVGGTRYTPGTLGQRLLEKYKSNLDMSDAEYQDQLLHGDGTTLESSMFDLMNDREEEACIGWSPEIDIEDASSGEDESNQADGGEEQEMAEQEGIAEEEGMILDARGHEKRRLRRETQRDDITKSTRLSSKWDKCWRAKMWHQINDFELPESMKIWPEMTTRNTQSLSRLSRCLLNPPNSIPQYPPSTSNPTHEQMSNMSGSTEETKWLENRDCSLTATKVVLGHWWYFTLAFADTENPGEAVWLRNQIEGLYEQGYTVLGVNSYEGMVEAHNALPDVISHIWTEDRHTLACQDDPSCVSFSTFEPTTKKYPNIELDPTTGEPTMWNQMPTDEQNRPKSKWVWTEDQLKSLGDGKTKNEKGTIPEWKLFTTTYWGARPGDPYWLFNDEEEFSWNALGQEWTLTPFDYPHHTYVPYSIEEQCLSTPFTSTKSDQLFVLAKKTEYFQDPWSAIPSSFWSKLESLTGLSAMSVAEDDVRAEGETKVDVPNGVETVGRVSKEEFEVLVGQSRLMLGIGRPLISPSVYSALCQGTPVIMPYFQGVAVPTGWDLFNGAYAQHGPAAAIGPPYVYSYDKDNETMLIEAIKTAASTPIGRYIPPDMSHSAELSNMDDLMRFNWKKHAQLIKDTNRVSKSDLRRIVVGRCFEIGRCEPMAGALYP